MRVLGYTMDPETGELSLDPNGGAKIVGFSREGVARVSKHDNLELQMRAARDLADRFYGKPRTANDLAGQNVNAVVINMPSDPEHYNHVARVLIETGAVPREVETGNGNGDPQIVESTAEETLNE